jgi:uncharacterized protein with NRDE domain
MCLLVLAWNAHPRYRLVVAANRDEYHDRPAMPLGRWAEPTDMVAGRDLRAGGTWLGIDRRRRFGVVTNFRDLVRAAPQARSRGGLIPGYLGGAAAAEDYLAALEDEAAAYGGFNLLLADGESLWYASNRTTPFVRALSPGVHGLSNELLDTPWPKLRRVRRGFEEWLLESRSVEGGELFALLADRTPSPESATSAKEGLGGAQGAPELSPAWERALSSPFVLHESYGTRCSTVVAVESTGGCYVAERRFGPSGVCTGETEYRLAPGDWPETSR